MSTIRFPGMPDRDALFECAEDMVELALGSTDTRGNSEATNFTTVVSLTLIAISDIPALLAIGRVVAPGALLALLRSAAFASGKRSDG